jgi:hypothetical protein
VPLVGSVAVAQLGRSRVWEGVEAFQPLDLGDGSVKTHVVLSSRMPLIDEQTGFGPAPQKIDYNGFNGNRSDDYG